MDHVPSVCPIEPAELLDFCTDSGYSYRVEAQGSLLIPPDYYVGMTDWERSLRLRCAILLIVEVLIVEDRSKGARLSVCGSKFQLCHMPIADAVLMQGGQVDSDGQGCAQPQWVASRACACSGPPASATEQRKLLPAVRAQLPARGGARQPGASADARLLRTPVAQWRQRLAVWSQSKNSPWAARRHPRHCSGSAVCGMRHSMPATAGWQQPEVPGACLRRWRRS